MKRVLLIGALSAALAACNSTTLALKTVNDLKPGVPTALTSTQTAVVQSSLRKALKDPDSARFGTVAAARGPDGAITVCGMVNAKNAYGGYTGEQPFMGTLSEAEFSLRYIADTQEQYTGTVAFCKEVGAVI